MTTLAWILVIAVLAVCLVSAERADRKERAWRRALQLQLTTMLAQPVAPPPEPGSPPQLRCINGGRQ